MTEQHCVISKCGTKNFKILITDAHFNRNLTNENDFPRSYDDLNSKSANVVYRLKCKLCGLVYVSDEYQ